MPKNSITNLPLDINICVLQYLEVAKRVQTLQYLEVYVAKRVQTLQYLEAGDTVKLAQLS